MKTDMEVQFGADDAEREVHIDLRNASASYTYDVLYGTLAGLAGDSMKRGMSQGVNKFLDVATEGLAEAQKVLRIEEGANVYPLNHPLEAVIMGAIVTLHKFVTAHGMPDGGEVFAPLDWSALISPEAIQRASARMEAANKELNRAHDDSPLH